MGKEEKRGEKQSMKRSTSKKKTNVSNSSRNKDKKSTSRRDSMDSTDEILSNLPKNSKGLRPPLVWNFPVERIEEIRKELQDKKDLILNLYNSKQGKGGEKRGGNKQEDKDKVIKEEPKKY